MYRSRSVRIKGRYVTTLNTRIYERTNEHIETFLFFERNNCGPDSESVDKSVSFAACQHETSWCIADTILHIIYVERCMVKYTCRRLWHVVKNVRSVSLSIILVMCQNGKTCR